MNEKEIKASIAPCGLCCETCFAHVDGDIRRYSLKLKEKLGNFRIYAERFETLLDNPIFNKYPAFEAVLDYLASENCKGCRNEQCRLFKGCGVRGCHQAKQVDYCHQCDAFPCDRTNFDPGMHKGWVMINRKIREVSLKEFYEKAKVRPRYL